MLVVVLKKVNIILNLNRKAVLFILCVSFLFHVTPFAFSERTDKSSRGSNFIDIKTDSFDINYEPDVNLKTVYRRLQQRRFYVSGTAKPGKLSNYDEKITYRINMLFARIKEMLDMYPPDVYFKIIIFEDSSAVNDEYYRIRREKRKVKAFYNHRFKTIYTSENTISDSVLAHELVHVVINNYFLIRPPEKVAEMMAIYADSHLD